MKIKTRIRFFGYLSAATFLVINVYHVKSVQIIYADRDLPFYSNDQTDVNKIKDIDEENIKHSQVYDSHTDHNSNKLRKGSNSLSFPPRKNYHIDNNIESKFSNDINLNPNKNSLLPNDNIDRTLQIFGDSFSLVLKQNEEIAKDDS